MLLGQGPYTNCQYIVSQAALLTASSPDLDAQRRLVFGCGLSQMLR